MTQPVLFWAEQIDETLFMENFKSPPEPNTDSIAVNQIGFGEYLSVYAGISVNLATVLLFAMTLAGIAVPVAAMALVFLAVRSKCLSIMASRPEFLTPWFDHLKDRAK